MNVNDYIKANRKAAREIHLGTGFKAMHKVHKSAKTYSRKVKHKKLV